MDAMVTARIAPEKKARGNEVLASLGMTSSGIINSLYDYLIAKGEAPDLSIKEAAVQDEATRAAVYAEFLQDTVLPIPASFWQNVDDDKQLLERALEEKYGSFA